jgi:DNA-binding MarR family transcriptional regulator
MRITEQRSWGITLKRAEQTLLRAKSTALKPAGLTVAQYVALTELDAHPGVTGATLARACLVSPQAMMVVLKGMEEQGLIKRSPHLRHPNVLEVHVTGVGREALHTARELLEPLERRLSEALPGKDAGRLVELLTRIVNTLDTTP